MLALNHELRSLRSDRCHENLIKNDTCSQWIESKPDVVCVYKHTCPL